jgi:hypothetical protein
MAGITLISNIYQQELNTIPFVKENKTPQPSNPLPENAPFFSKEKERDGENSGEPRPFFTKPPVQLKAEISQPDDPQEREADKVADKIMRMPESQVVDKKDEPRVKKESPPPDKLSGGQPLPETSQSFFGKRLGTDFSEVKIHTGDKAAQSAKDLQAKAYTSGNHVVFAKGQYAPDTEAGKKLLAHELTHVVQQTGSGTPDQEKIIQRELDINMYNPELEQIDREHKNLNVATTTQNWDQFRIFNQTPSLDYIICFLKSLISEKGFKEASYFIESYNIRADSVEEETHREVVRPILKIGFDNVKREASAFIEGSFFDQAKSFVQWMLMNSEAVVEGDARKFGLASTGITNNDPIARFYIASLGIEAKKIIDSLHRIENLKKRLRDLMAPVYETNPYDPSVLMIVGEKITDPVLHKELSAQLKTEEKNDALIRYNAEMQFPILASFRPENKLDELESLAEGKSKYAKNLWILLDDINEKRDSIAKIRKFLLDESREKQLAFFLKHEMVLSGTKSRMGVFPKSLYDQALNDKVKEIKSSEFMANLGLALLGLAGALLASIPTGGGSLVAWGAAVAGGGILLGTGGYSIYKSVSDYNLEKAASGTAFDKARAISAKEPSAFFLALEIVMSVVDIGQAVSVFAKGIKALNSARSLNSAAEELYASHEVFRTRFRSVDEVKEFLRINSKETTLLLGETWKTREGLLKQLTSGEHPKFQQLLAGSEEELKNLLSSHGNWKELITGLNNGTQEMKDIAKNLQSFRDIKVTPELEKKFGAKIQGISSTDPVSDRDFTLISDTLGGAGQKLVDAEAHMHKLFGKDWSEALRINFYPDLQSRLLIMDKVASRIPTQEELIRITLERSQLSTKFNLARELQSAVNNPSRLAGVEKRIKDLGYDMSELKKLASTDEYTAIARRNELNIKIDQLEKELRNMPGQEGVRKAEEIQKLQMEANFYTKEATISPDAARDMLKVSTPSSAQYSEALKGLNKPQQIKLAKTDAFLEKKFDLAQRYRIVQDNPVLLKEIENEALKHKIDIGEIKRLAGVSRMEAIQKQDALLIALEEKQKLFLASTKGKDKLTLAQEIRKLEAEYKFYRSGWSLQVSDSIIDWLAMFHHCISEKGIHQAMREYEPWKYMSRVLEYAKKYQVPKEKYQVLEDMYKKAKNIYKHDRTLPEREAFSKVASLAEKENLELYNQFITESYEIAYMIRVKEMEIIKRFDPKSLLLIPRHGNLSPSDNTSSPEEAYSSQW